MTQERAFLNDQILWVLWNFPQHGCVMFLLTFSYVLSRMKTGRYSPVRPRETSPLKAGKEAQLRVNLEQTLAFRPRSRKVHLNKEGGD
jgi:hypothetical protein